MKKTFTINISGIVFHIDEDAYEQLQTYLNKIHRRFEGTEEGKEILTDIETRIAELFTERITSSKQVICEDDVSEIIGIMGDPTEFDEEGEEPAEEPTYSRRREWKVGRRLYRDNDHRVLGGVCSGIGAYFDIDPVIIRVIFILLLLVPGFILIYFVLWIVIPQALTTAQKLEMRGERVNISNIEKTITEEFTEVKNNFRNFSRSRQYEQTKDSVHSIFQVFGTIITGFVKVVLGIVGVAFILAGILILVVMLGSFFTDQSFFWPQEDFQGLISTGLLLFSDIENIRIFLVGLVIVIGVPILAIIYGGFKLIFRFDANDKAVGGIGFIVWVIGLIIAVGSVFLVASEMRASERVVNEEVLRTVDGDMLFVSAKPDTLNYRYNNYYNLFDFDEVKILPYDEQNVVFITPKFSIKKSKDNRIHVYERRDARGENRRDAYDNAQLIEYDWVQNDSLIIVDRYYTLGENAKWRGQEYKITIELPVGKSILLDESMSEILWESYYIDNRIWPGNLVDNVYTMTDDGLEAKEE